MLYVRVLKYDKNDLGIGIRKLKRILGSINPSTSQEDLEQKLSRINLGSKIVSPPYLLEEQGELTVRVQTGYHTRIRIAKVISKES